MNYMKKIISSQTVFIVLPAIVLTASFVLIMDQSSPTTKQQTEDTDTSIEKTEDNDTTDYTGGITELGIEDISVGDGKEAQKGDTVSVHYTGTLLNGEQFDSSYDRGEPFSFTIGEGGVIQGWEQGIPGMKVGGKRKLTIPADLGYGETGSGSIPPNATLVFEVELVEVQ